MEKAKLNEIIKGTGGAMQKIILLSTGNGDAQRHMDTIILNQVSKETVKRYILRRISTS